MDPVSLALAGAAAGSLFRGIGGYIGGQQSAAGARQGGQTASLFDLLGIQQANQASRQWYDTAASTLNPYISAGNTSRDMLMRSLQGTGARDAGIGGGGATLLSTFAPTMSQLEQTPGYQWTRQQTLGAMTNSGAARGLGASGNLVQGLGEAATGLASTTFNDQLRNYMSQNLQAYNMLMGPTGLGANAANVLASGALNLGGRMADINMQGFGAAGTALGGSQMSAANAQAQGTNALAGGAGQAASYAASSPLANIYAEQATGARTPQQTLAALNTPVQNYGYASPIFQPLGYRGPLNFSLA